MQGTGQRRAVIVGGSMAGLFAGNLLRHHGWAVDIYERVAGPLNSRGAGIAGHIELTALLEAAGVGEHALVGIDVDGRVAYGPAGERLASFAHHQYLTPWAAVFDLLRGVFPDAQYHAGVEVRDIVQGERQTVAVLSDGSSVTADLIVGADGFRSKVRTIVAPATEPRYGGYVAFRGLVHEKDLSPRFRAEVFGNFAFVFPGDGQFIGYPLLRGDNAAAVDERRYGYLWYRPVASGAALRDLLTDSEATTHEYSIPPPLIRPEHVAAIKRHAARTLPALFQEPVLRAYQHMLQPIYDVASEQVGFGRVALIGDAAFVARPHVGIGVLKAGQDAEALVRCLRGTADVVEAVRAFDRERVPQGRAAVRFAAHLGAFIERGLPFPWSDPALGLSPEYILRTSARPLSHLADELAAEEQLRCAS